MRNFSDLCKKCGKCCQVIVLPIPGKIMEKSYVQDWLSVRKCKVVAKDPYVSYVMVDHTCPQLKKANGEFSCAIYQDRPEACKNFDGRNFGFLDCAWKSKDSYIILEKAGDPPGWIGARKFVGKREKRRTARRASRERRREKAEDIKLYGSALEED